MTFWQWLLNFFRPRPTTSGWPIPLDGLTAGQIAISRAIVDAINAIRQNVGAAPVVYNEVLARCAQAIAADNAKHPAFLSHKASDGSQVQDRVSRAGYRFSWVGECLDEGPSDPPAAVKLWVSSPPHYAIMISDVPDIRTEAGGGMAVAADGSYVWSCTFARSA